MQLGFGPHLRLIASCDNQITFKAGSCAASQRLRILLIMNVKSIVSPCIQVCVVDGPTGWCLGCGRTLKEIVQWTKYTDQQRDDIIEDGKSRLNVLKEQGKLG